jgi:hypothetical protein
MDDNHMKSFIQMYQSGLIGHDGLMKAMKEYLKGDAPMAPSTGGQTPEDWGRVIVTKEEDEVYLDYSPSEIVGGFIQVLANNREVWLSESEIWRLAVVDNNASLPCADPAKVRQAMVGPCLILLQMMEKVRGHKLAHNLMVWSLGNKNRKYIEGTSVPRVCPEDWERGTKHVRDFMSARGIPL